jgi:hypothetical protein
MTQRPNGANGDQCTLFRVPFQGTKDVVWLAVFPGFHPVLAFTCCPFGAHPSGNWELPPGDLASILNLET